jgi:modification methylase
LETLFPIRKPGGYRQPTTSKRVLSVIPEEKHREWFQQIWQGVTGASTRQHPAPYPLELAERLIRMFSFVGDTVFDPFMGTASTNVAAARCGRNSIGVEVDSLYFQLARKRLEEATRGLFEAAAVHVG